MRSFTATTTIDRPAAEAWAIVADYHCDPQWRHGVETMAPSTTGPAVVGTTTAEVLRLGGRTYRNAGLVTEVQSGSRLAWRTVAGADAFGSRDVRPSGSAACTVTLELHVRYHGGQRLAAPLLTGMLRRGLRRDLARLAALVVDRAPPGQSVPCGPEVAGRSVA